MKDNNHRDRDLELDALLSPLRAVQPGEFRLTAWQRAVERVRREAVRRPKTFRLVEWAVAASVGFMLATMLNGLRATPAGESEMASHWGSEEFGGVDATEIRFVAKSH
jgi:hypothetical protein